MRAIKFFEEVKQIKTSDTFVISLTTVKNKAELLNRFNEYGYFGSNWDALSDCLRSLYDVKEQGLILIHDDLQYFNCTDLKIYIEVLVRAINRWENTGYHYIDAYFQKNNIDIIRPILDQIKIMYP